MRYLLTGLVALLLAGCNLGDEAQTIKSFADGEKVWVFAQFNVREETDDLESYYYYAQISKSLYEAMANNEINSGFIYLENVRYWGEDDIVHEYRDSQNSGEIIFRIENTVKVDLVAAEPIVGQGLEQFDEPASKSEQQAELEGIKV
ncbi:hypothetical protein [Ferrimonas sp. YFM]|uniref:hypothetical protein n=1 Tax=Ferrimonas sp. YFM TaxID=3028878 RepID=UPI00257489F3|nr:hypothetical protein [Ferrimonas sp. YFM]BDY04470.1 hypothetical protein F0521_15110 [Ferrimonas sp. YFM]